MTFTCRDASVAFSQSQTAVYLRSTPPPALLLGWLLPTYTAADGKRRAAQRREAEVCSHSEPFNRVLIAQIKYTNGE